MPKALSEFEHILMAWWTGLGHDGNPLTLWERLDRNHFRPDLGHLRAMLAADGVAKHSVQVELVGETEANSFIRIVLRDKLDSPLIVGDSNVKKPNSEAAPVVVEWKPPHIDGDNRTVMDIAYNGRAHSRHVKSQHEARAALAQAKQKADEQARSDAAKQDRSLRDQEGG